ncbi:MAG: ABC transporter permease [Pirellulales bacterium]
MRSNAVKGTTSGWGQSVAIAGTVAAALAVLIVTSAEPRVQTLLAGSLLFAGGSSSLALLPGTLLALLVVKTDLPGRRMVIALLGVLLLMPLYLQAAAWQAGFGIGGWFARLWHTGPLLAGWRGAVWVQAVAAVPWIALIVGFSLRQVPAELEEQALVDGSGRQVFWHVTLRQVTAGMVIALLWTAATATADITVTDLFQIRTYAEEIYTRLSLVGWNVEQASHDMGHEVALVVLGIVAAGLACLRLAPQSDTMTVRPSWRWKLGRWRTAVAAAVALILTVIVAVPLISLLLQAGLVVTETGHGRLRHWSLAKAAGLVASSPWEFATELKWSLTIGAAASTTAIGISVLLAWLARRGRLQSLPIVLTAAICLALPGPSIGLGLIHLLNRPDDSLLTWLYDRTLLAPWIAQTFHALPLTLLIVWYALVTIPAEMIDRAVADGAGPIRRLLCVAVPYRAAEIGAAWLVGLVLAMGELAATLLTAPPGMPTLSVRLFGLLHYGVDDRLAALCLSEIVCVTTVLAVAGTLARTTRRAGDGPAVGGPV